MVVRRFFKHGCDNLVVLDLYVQVHEVHLYRARADNPVESKDQTFHVGDEAIPFFSVCGWVGVNPDTNNVINAASVNGEVGCKYCQKVQLAEGILQVCPWWGRRGAHGCASILDPRGVSKGKHIQGHNDLNGFDEGFCGNMLELHNILSDVLGDELQGAVSVDVCIH
jgi:hypothetical protein